jgi:hypothetical protein
VTPLLNAFQQVAKVASSDHSLLLQILHTANFKRICMQLSYTNDLYDQHFRKISESNPLEARKLFGIIFDKQEPVWTKENANLTGPNTVLLILSTLNKWTFYNSLIDLRLLLDVWRYFSIPSQLIVQLLLRQLTRSIEPSILCKLAAALPSIQEQLFQETQNILKNNQVLLGAQTVKKFLTCVSIPTV